LAIERSAVAGGGPGTGLIAAVALTGGRAIGSFADAVAVLVRVVPAVELATLPVIVTSAVPPAATVPRLQVTVCPEVLQAP
jgi:hypothetical protein